MNTIEMQSITALAHLKSCVLYFMDLSERCGYIVEAQCKLFHSIKPLFGGKTTMLGINKIDITRLEDLSPDNWAMVQEIIDSEDVHCVQVSCYSEEGGIDLACDALLARRVDHKLKGSKHSCGSANSTRRCRTRTVHPRCDSEWKSDIIPEIMYGKIVADFIDTDIVERLEDLEREEEKLEAEGFNDSEEDVFDAEDERKAVRAKKVLGHEIISQSVKKAMKNTARLPRTAGLRTLGELTTELTKSGYDPSKIQELSNMIAKVQGAKQKRADADMDVDMESGDGEDGGEEGWMDVDEEQTPNKRVKDNSRADIAKNRREPRSNHQLAGMRDEAVVIKLRNLRQRERNMHAKVGGSDRAIRVKTLKYLFAGQRKDGKTDRRWSSKHYPYHVYFASLSFDMGNSNVYYSTM